MVFPSLPIYLDPPNWSQQQPNLQAEIGIQNPPAPQPPSSTVAAGSGGCQGSSIRPGSMADRARLAKIHQADATLKCPRCESTNTKFCYYNNYSLSQPRHFCKTCRRYWTRGGALRNVPVGGGCRRNKRSKTASKSPLKPSAVASSTSPSANSSYNHRTVTTAAAANSDMNVVMGGHLPTQFPFLPSLHHYNNNGYINSGGIGNSTSSTNAEFQIGNGSNSNGGSLFLSNGIGEQWRLPNLQQLHQHQPHQHQHQHQQQFPFLTNLEPQIGLFQFGNGAINAELPSNRFLRSKAMEPSSSVSVSTGIVTQVNTIKMEESNQQGLNLPKNLLSGGSGNNNELFWNGSGNNAWSHEVPSFTPSQSHLL